MLAGNRLLASSDSQTNDVVFGHEAPEARVGRVVAVVAHHPVVVHGEGVLCGRGPVDADHAVVADLQLMAFVGLDDAAVEGQVLRRERHRGPPLRDPDRAVVVLTPAGVAPLREDVVVGGIDVAADRDDVLERLDLLGGLGRQRHVVRRSVAAVLRDAEVVDGIL